MRMLNQGRIWILGVTLTILLLGAGSAMGSGFAIVEQSVKGLGYAFAGASAMAEDASTVYWNPAGMARLQAENELQLGVHYIIPKAEFRDKGSTSILGAPLNGGNGGDGGESAWVPNLFYMHSFSDKWKAGIGITAPYGLATQYDDNWKGRYHGLKSELRTIDINPSVSYRINSQWSVGGGLSFQKANAELSNAIDYGTAIASATGNLALSQNVDGKGTVEGDNWGYGFNIGLMYELSQETRFGFHYRSSVKHQLKGDGTFENPALAVAAGIALPDSDVKADVDIPETVNLSGYHAFNEQWAVLADISWTRWSRLEELRIKFDNPAIPDSVTTLDWDDTWRFAAGLKYKPVQPVDLRFGIAFDQTPVPSKKRRTVRIPDNDRFWLSFGAGYQFNERVTFDFGYAHLFINDYKIEKDITEAENRLRGALVGEYDASVDIISAAVTFNF